MTWSIIARDPRTGRFRHCRRDQVFAVGARVPHIEPGIGAHRTQALINPLYGTQGCG